MEPIIIDIVKVINSPFCVDANDGEKINCLLEKALKEKKHVALSFAGAELVITAFLNTAVGRLFKDYDQATINTYLTYKDLNKAFEPMWNKVVENAPLYYADQEGMEKRISEIIEE